MVSSELGLGRVSGGAGRKGLVYQLGVRDKTTVFLGSNAGLL
jgi:hypothetical protein